MWTYDGDLEMDKQAALVNNFRHVREEQTRITRGRSLRDAQRLHGNGDIDHITHHPHVEKFAVSHAEGQAVKGKCRVKSGHHLFLSKGDGVVP